VYLQFQGAVNKVRTFAARFPRILRAKSY